MLISANRVTAMSMSAWSAPALASTSGCAPWPTTPLTSSVSVMADMSEGCMSMTDTSLPSCERRSAIP